MNRTRFYNTVTVFEKKQLDYLFNNLSRFVITRDVTYYRVGLADEMRPDLLSFRNYGTVRFWWIVCLVNNIANPLVEIAEGTLLTLPSIADIQDFYRKNVVR